MKPVVSKTAALRAGVAILAVAMSTGANAQSSSASVQAVPPPGTAPTASESPPAGQTSSVAPSSNPQADAADPGPDITVTARRRDERLQDVPISIAAYSGDLLEAKDIRNVQGTFGLTPGLYFTGNLLSPGRDFRQLVIRGVGANSQLEPSVATFIDGVYSPALSFDSELLDVERIEVLKGPQGALFGRNTEGGAVSIITRKPDDETHVRLNLLADEFSTAQASASISGPIVAGKLFANLSVQYRYSDYFVEVRGLPVIPRNPFFPGVDLAQIYNPKYTDPKPASGQRQVTSRSSIRYVPDDTTELTVTGHFSDFKGVDQAPGPLESCRCYVVDGDLAYQQTSQSYGGSGQAEKKFGGVRANLIVGYEYASSSSPYDFDGTRERVGNYHDFDRIQKSTSAELRLASDHSGKLQWLAGLYGFHEQQFSNRFYIFSNMDAVGGPQSAFDGLWNQQIVTLKRDGVAGFGQATYAITDQLELAVGARYSWEKVKVSALERFQFPANGVFTAPLTSIDLGWKDYVTPVLNDKSFKNFSPQASVSYKVVPTLTAYASVARGFKAGSFQVAPVTPEDVTAVDPETTTNYEIGLKGSLLDRLVTFELAGFHIDIKNQQLSSIIIRSGIASAAITSASKSRVNGFEATIALQPSDRLNLNGNVAYTDSRFVDYSVLPGDTNGDGVVNNTDIVSRSGQSQPNTPRWSYNVGAQYTVPIGTASLSFDANYRYIGSTYNGGGTNINDPILNVPSWDRLDIGATIRQGPLSFRVFADNVTNNYIILSKFNSFEVYPRGAYVHNFVDIPRRIGASIGYKF